MTTYVALLHGINVGGKRRVPMQTLRELLTGLGGGAVRTHLNSGNAVFTHDGAGPEELTASLERALADRLGFPVRCVVREAADLRRVIDANPFAGRDFLPARLLVTFLSAPARPGPVADLDPAAYLPDVFALGEREVYLLCPDGLRDSRLAQALARRSPAEVATARNWNTVSRLAELAGV
ncbi:DUF1697 domain-containing protein [Streptomyces orinoci]|uniref:DUF1697 domain-containing protein n=1 Tax=Streptomyces orinoci TaxID=67339 RepID=A0ABV3JS33_STRON|nr:DUF1697 domain-containing protein [Streptomyces orinoci]